MVQNEESYIEDIVFQVGHHEVNIVGVPTTKLLIKNEQKITKGQSGTDLTEDEGGYDLAAPELVLQILSLIISFATLGLKVYETYKNKKDQKIKDQKEEIEFLRHEVLKQKLDLNKLEMEKQLEICKRIVEKYEPK